MLHLAWLAASNTPIGDGGFDPWSLVTSAGVAGIFAGMFAVGKIRSKVEVDDLREDRNKARADLAKLQTSLIEQVIPALTRATEAMERLSPEPVRRREG